MESPVVFISPGVRTISGMASMATRSVKPAQPDSRGFCFLPPLLGSAVTSPVMPGEVLGSKSRLQGSYHPCWGSTLTKVKQKVKRNQHINSSPFLLEPWWTPLCIWFHRPDQVTHCVFSWSRSQCPYASLCICYFSIPDWLPFHSLLLSSNISIYPGLNLCVLG